MNKYYTLRLLADRYGCSTQTMNKWLVGLEPDLISHEQGRARLWEEDRVLSWLEKRQRGLGGRNCTVKPLHYPTKPVGTHKVTKAEKAQLILKVQAATLAAIEALG